MTISTATTALDKPDFICQDTAHDTNDTQQAHKPYINHNSETPNNIRSEDYLKKCSESANRDTRNGHDGNGTDNDLSYIEDSSGKDIMVQTIEQQRNFIDQLAKSITSKVEKALAEAVTHAVASIASQLHKHEGNIDNLSQQRRHNTNTINNTHKLSKVSMASEVGEVGEVNKGSNGSDVSKVRETNKIS